MIQWIQDAYLMRSGSFFFASALLSFGQASASYGQTTKYVAFLQVSDSAYKYYEQGDYFRFSKVMEEVYSDTSVTYPDAFFDLAKAKYLSNEKTSNYYWFKRSIALQGVEISHLLDLEKDTLFEKSLRSDPRWNHLIDIEYPQLRAGYVKTLDTTYMAIIDSLMTEDQAIRDRREEFEDIEMFRYQIRKVDSLNFEMLKMLIDERGLPNRFRIGNPHSAKFLIMLFHYIHPNDSLDWQVYSKMVVDEFVCRGGFVHGFMIMFFIDKNVYYSNLHGGGYQLYGTWYDKQTNRILPIWDEKNVDSRRHSMGVKPLSEYARENGYLLPEGYTTQLN